MKTITIWNMKGGVGKTTLTFHLAANLEHFGKKILCLDFDPQANLTSFFEKDNGKSRKKCDIQELAEHCFHGLDKSIYKTKYKGINYIKGSNRQGAADRVIYGLETALKKVEDLYDYCLIDCHPDFSAMTQTALFSADLVLVPILLDAFSRDNLNLVRNHLEQIECMENYGDGKGEELSYYVVANRVANRKSQKNVYQDIITRHDYPVLDICIGEGAAVQSANQAHKPLYAHRSSAAACKDLMELARHIEKLSKGVV